MCLRCSPGLFRHGGGAASCHTSSMAAKPHLALTKNSSPTTLANGRQATQIAGSRGKAPVAPRTGRNTRWPQPAKHPRRARRELPNRPKPSSAADGIPGAAAAAPWFPAPACGRGAGNHPETVPAAIAPPPVNGWEKRSDTFVGAGIPDGPGRWCSPGASRMPRPTRDGRHGGTHVSRRCTALPTTTGVGAGIPDGPGRWCSVGASRMPRPTRGWTARRDPCVPPLHRTADHYWRRGRHP